MRYATLMQTYLVGFKVEEGLVRRPLKKNQITNFENLIVNRVGKIIQSLLIKEDIGKVGREK